MEASDPPSPIQGGPLSVPPKLERSTDNSAGVEICNNRNKLLIKRAMWGLAAIVLGVGPFILELGFDVVKDLTKDAIKQRLHGNAEYSQQEEKTKNIALVGPPDDKSNSFETGSIERSVEAHSCIEEESAMAALRTLRAMPRNTRKEKFKPLFADRNICETGWIGRVAEKPRQDKVTHAWEIPLSDGVVLHSFDEAWGAIAADQRIRYVGKLSEYLETDTIIVSDAKFIRIIPEPAPKPLPPKPSPGFFEKFDKLFESKKPEPSTNK